VHFSLPIIYSSQSIPEKSSLLHSLSSSRSSLFRVQRSRTATVHLKGGKHRTDRTTLEVPAHATVGDLRLTVAVRDRFPVGSLKLLFQGQLLTDATALSSIEFSN
jgi:hypothetical protein